MICLQPLQHRFELEHFFLMCVFVVLSPFSLRACCWLYRCSSHSQTLSCPLGNIYVSFCFSGGFLGSFRAAWPLRQIPLPARSSLCNEVTADMIYPACEFQSKQQLVVFSSLRDTVDPLWKACYSLHSSNGDIPTYCFSDTHSAALVKQLRCDENQAKSKIPL